jgi:hypothetical protein
MRKKKAHQKIHNVKFINAFFEKKRSLKVLREYIHVVQSIFTITFINMEGVSPEDLKTK